MKKALAIIIFILLLVSGLSVLLYPTVSQMINAKSQTRAVEAYQSDLEDVSDETFKDLMDAANKYNTSLAAGDLSFDSEEAEEKYKASLKVGASNVIGFVEIPKLSIRLPMYHGTSPEVLQIGIGHIQGTSLPVGGINTHTVLSGHRGLPSASLFTNIDQLELGDSFSLKVLKETLTYEVDRIQVVTPEAVDNISLIPGGDYATLITCTPYAVNTHRLLVRGKRIENPLVQEIPQEGRKKPSVSLTQVLLIAAALAPLMLLFGLIVSRKRYRDKARAAKLRLIYSFE
ncbi:class C sortase [Clostridiaceae bacterium OttesenSCG-928-D20]|nr:class C sortase [Clostridiaceae bacterium OttesenSCG-928-D20]